MGCRGCRGAGVAGGAGECRGCRGCRGVGFRVERQVWTQGAFRISRVGGVKVTLVFLWNACLLGFGALYVHTLFGSGFPL